jgi:hypothetical protein
LLGFAVQRVPGQWYTLLAVLEARPIMGALAMALSNLFAGEFVEI